MKNAKWTFVLVSVSEINLYTYPVHAFKSIINAKEVIKCEMTLVTMVFGFSFESHGMGGLMGVSEHLKVFSRFFGMRKKSGATKLPFFCIMITH